MYTIFSIATCNVFSWTSKNLCDRFLGRLGNHKSTPHKHLTQILKSFSIDFSKLCDSFLRRPDLASVHLSNAPNPNNQVLFVSLQNLDLASLNILSSKHLTHMYTIFSTATSKVFSWTFKIFFDNFLGRLGQHKSTPQKHSTQILKPFSTDFSKPCDSFLRRLDLASLHLS